MTDTAPDVWRVEDEAVCGRCFGGFDSSEPPMHVIKHSRGYDYAEDRPWHESCVAKANAEAAGAGSENGC